MVRERIGFPAALALGAALALAACQSVPDADVSSLTEEPPEPSVEMGSLAFAQGACGDCHAVSANALSPNTAAPGFARIANTQGLTRETLGTWLTDAHNYPEQMDFYLDPPEVEMLVDYILTLQDADYEPPIQ